MKKQTQDTGIRKWFGDDWINLQNEIYKAIETGILSGGTGIVSGVNRTSSGSDYTFSPGLVMIDGQLYTFAGHTSTNGTIYIVPSISHDTREYLQGGPKNITNNFETFVDYTIPTGSHIKVDQTTKNRYFILKTDENNKFGVDFENIIKVFLSQQYGLQAPTVWMDIPGAMYETPHVYLGAPKYMKDSLGYYRMKGYWNGSWLVPPLTDDSITFMNLPKDSTKRLSVLELLDDGTVSQHIIREGGVNEIKITHNNQLSIKIDLSTIPPFK